MLIITQAEQCQACREVSNKAINVLCDLNHAIMHVVTWLLLVLETLNISRPSPRPGQRCINSGCLSRKVINFLYLPYTDLIQTLTLYSHFDAWEGGKEIASSFLHP